MQREAEVKVCRETIQRLEQDKATLQDEVATLKAHAGVKVRTEEKTRLTAEPDAFQADMRDQLELEVQR